MLWFQKLILKGLIFNTYEGEQDRLWSFGEGVGYFSTVSPELSDWFEYLNDWMVICIDWTTMQYLESWYAPL